MPPTHWGSTDRSVAARRQQALRDVIDKANRSGTVIHTIDMRGVAYMRPGQVPRFWATQQGMAQLAWGTGGLAAFDNGYVQAMQRVEADQQGYYLIGFKAPEACWGCGEEQIRLPFRPGRGQREGTAGAFPDRLLGPDR